MTNREAVEELRQIGLKLQRISVNTQYGNMQETEKALCEAKDRVLDAQHLFEKIVEGEK